MTLLILFLAVRIIRVSTVVVTTFSGWGTEPPNLKLAKIQNMAFWLKSPNLIPAKFSFYMVLWLQPLHIELSCWYTVGTLNLPQQNNNYFPRWYTISEKSVNINCCRVRVPYSCQVHQLQPSSHTEGSLCMHIHLSNSWSPEMIALIHIYWLWDDCFQRNDQDIAKILCIA